MKTNRTIVLGSVVSLVLLAACQTAPPTTPEKKQGNERTVKTKKSTAPTTGSPKPTATKTPTPNKTLTPNAPTPTPSPNGKPVFSQLTGSVNPKNETTLRGKVFDETGKLFNDTVNVELKGKASSFTATVTNGEFVFDNDKLKGNIGPITLKADNLGFTSRSQYWIITAGSDYTVNFGEKGTASAAYCMFDHPEIASIEPNQFTKDVKSSALNFTIQLSEPITGVNKMNFLTSLYLVPANDVAAGPVGDKKAADLSAAEAKGVATFTQAKLDDFPYVMQLFTTKKKEGTNEDEIEGIPFFGVKPTFGVDATETKFTIGIPFALLNGQMTKDGAGKDISKPAKYSLLLAPPADKVGIKDAKGNLLGTDGTGKHADLLKNQIWNNMFLSPFLGPDSFDPTDAVTQWNSSHTNANTVTFVPDGEPPKLTGIAVSLLNEKVGGKDVPTHTQILLSFSEAMVVPGPGGRIIRPDTLALENYTFAVANAAEALSGAVALNGTVINEVDPSAEGFGSDANVIGKEFKFKTVTTGKGRVEMDFENPTTVKIIFRDNVKLFDKEKAKAIAVRAVKVADPANNDIKPEQANKPENQPKASIPFPPNPT